MEVRKNNLKLHNIDNRDLFNLLDIFLNNNESRVKRREQAKEYMNRYKEGTLKESFEFEP